MRNRRERRKKPVYEKPRLLRHGKIAMIVGGTKEKEAPEGSLGVNPGPTWSSEYIF